MQKTIFKTQPFRLILETETNLATATKKEIVYTKPSGTKGKWTASALSATQIYRDITGTENDQAGTWTFHALITFGSGVNATPGVDAELVVADYVPTT